MSELTQSTEVVNSCKLQGKKHESNDNPCKTSMSKAKACHDRSLYIDRQRETGHFRKTLATNILWYSIMTPTGSMDRFHGRDLRFPFPTPGSQAAREIQVEGFRENNSGNNREQWEQVGTTSRLR